MGRKAAERPSTDTLRIQQGQGPEQPDLAPELGVLSAAGWTR